MKTVSLLYYHSVYRRLSLAVRQLQWSVTLLYYHTPCRGLSGSHTLLCRLSSSHLTTCTTRSAKGQAGPSTCKREGDISQSYSCSNTMHAIRPAALHAHVSVAPYQPICTHRAIASARRIKRSVASTTSRLNSSPRGQT